MDKGEKREEREVMERVQEEETNRRTREVVHVKKEF